MFPKYSAQVDPRLVIDSFLERDSQSLQLEYFFFFSLMSFKNGRVKKLVNIASFICVGVSSSTGWTTTSRNPSLSIFDFLGMRVTSCLQQCALTNKDFVFECTHA